MRNRSSHILSKYAVIFGGIVLFALSLRAGCIIFLSRYLDSNQTRSVDASSYNQIAQNLVERHIFTSSVDPPYDLQKPSTFRPPLTPFYLAAIYVIFGTDLFWGRLGLAVLSALSCGMTYKFGARLFGRTSGVIAGGISCVYPFFLLLVLLPLTEGISIFLSLLLIIILYSDQLQKKSFRETQGAQWYFTWIVSVGIVFGLVLLNKAANIVLLPCILFWGIFQLPGSWLIRLSRVLVVMTTTTLIILPWAIRNQKIVGTITPINSNGGWTFYLGNNEHTDKNLRALEEGTSNGWIPPKEVYEPFADLTFGDTKNYEKRAVRLGLNFIWEHPGIFINYAFRKLKIFWSPYHHLVDKITWYPLALFGIVGLGYSLRCWKDHLLLYLLILSTMIIPVFFTSMPRFRAPIMPFLIVYAAFGLVKAGQVLKRRAGVEKSGSEEIKKLRKTYFF